jgi:hypothetical protein
MADSMGYTVFFIYLVEHYVSDKGNSGLLIEILLKVKNRYI